MLSFLLGFGVGFALSIFKPEWFRYIKEQVAGLFTKAGVDVPVEKKDE